MKITILTDDLKSWFIPHGEKLRQKLLDRGYDVIYVHSKKDLRQGDICFVLSCVRLLDEEHLGLNKHNIVVHGSDLPHGRGWSPLQWQILEGRNEIPLTLIQAESKMDEGPYYLKSVVKFDGTELLSDLRTKFGEEIVNMCIQFVEQMDSLTSKEQIGEPSYFRRRNDADDEINADLSIRAIFNHLRIADNDRHPVYFRHLGKKYLLKIYVEKNFPDPS